MSEARRFRCPVCGAVRRLELAQGQSVLCVCGHRLARPDESASVVGPSGATGRAPSEVPPGGRGEDVLQPGERVGHCLVERRIGGGAMGQVYLARHTVLGIPVALKAVDQRQSHQAGSTERFLREARTAAEMHHPNVVRVLDCGAHGSLLYLVLEYLDGGTVGDQLARAKRLPVRQALEVGRDVARALVEAERHHIVHRDIKPDNIMVGPDGGYKLADLGLARHVVGVTQTASVTSSPAGMGTPYYMPPEQARDARFVDHRADLYALGATLYHLLAGRPPYPGTDVVEVLRQHAQAPLTPLCRLNPGVPDGVFRVVSRCLAKQPADRYASAQDLLHDLELLLTHPAAAGAQLRANRPAPVTPAGRRHVLPWSLAALVGITGIVLLLVVGRGGRGPEPTTPGEPTSAGLVQDEIRTLSARLQQPGLPSATALRVWARLGEAYSQVGDGLKAFQCLCGVAKAARALPEEQRLLQVERVNRAATAFVSFGARGDDAVPVEMAYLRGLYRGLFPESRLVMAAAWMETGCGGVEVRGHPSALPCYWLAVDYPFDRPQELDDLLVPGPDWVRAAGAGRGAAAEVTRLVDGECEVGAPSVPLCVLWRVPLGGSFRVRWRVRLPAAGAGVDADLLVGLPATALYLPARDGIGVSLSRAGDGIGVAVRAGGARLVETVFAATSEPLEVAVSGALPQFSVEVQGRTLYAGEPAGRAAVSPGFVGVVARAPLRLADLRVEFPAEDAMAAARQGPLFLYPLMARGSRRFDRSSWARLGTLAGLAGAADQSAPAVPAGGAELTLLDGVLMSQRGTGSDTPALVGCFPVVRGLSAAPVEVSVVTVAAHRDPSGQAYPGVLELLNRETGQWERFRRVGSYAVPGEAGFVSEFRFQCAVARPYLSVHDEFLVRHYAAEAAGGSLAVDCALLGGQWRLPGCRPAPGRYGSAPPDRPP